MEHFQWITSEASRELDATKRQAVGEEIADVMCYALAIVNELDLDLTKILLAKMEKNRQKYPAEKFRGRYGFDDPNPVSEKPTVDQ